MRNPILAIAAAAILVTGTAALAQSAQLRFDDLDLASDAGKAELSRRIDLAAEQACPPESITGSRMSLRAAQQRCIADAKQQITVQLARKANRQQRGG